MDTSPRAPSEVEELNRILEVERRLVLRTQYNYKVLKEKCVLLKTECTGLRREMEELLMERDQLRATRAVEEDLAERSKEVVRLLDEDSRNREERARRLQVETVAELQRALRKEVEEQRLEMERQKGMKEEMEEENERLGQEIRNMREEERKKDKMHRLQRKELEEAMERMLRDRMEAEEGLRLVEKGREEGRSSRVQIEELEEKILELTRQAIRKDSEHSDRLRIAERIVQEESSLREEAEANGERLAADLVHCKETIRKKEERIEEVQRRVNELLNANSELAMASSKMERRLQKEMEKERREHEEKWTAIEMRHNRRNHEYNELAKSIAELEIVRKNLKESEKRMKELSGEKTKEERRRKEVEKEHEVSRQRLEAELARVQEERDHSERKCLVLKKRLETDPETADEVARLRQKLRKSEGDLNETKEHYRALLKRLKVSLRNLESRHERTQQKLANSVIL